MKLSDAMNAEDDTEKRPALTKKPGRILVTMGLRGSSATGVIQNVQLWFVQEQGT